MRAEKTSRKLNGWFRIWNFSSKNSFTRREITSLFKLFFLSNLHRTKLLTNAALTWPKEGGGVQMVKVGKWSSARGLLDELTREVATLLSIHSLCAATVKANAALIQMRAKMMRKTLGSPSGNLTDWLFLSSDSFELGQGSTNFFVILGKALVSHCELCLSAFIGFPFWMSTIPHFYDAVFTMGGYWLKYNKVNL